MFKKPLLLETLLAFILVWVLNRYAMIHHLYWSLSEFDSVVHFFGGVSAAAFLLWFYFYSGFFNPTDRSLTKFLTIAIFGTLFVGISWEIFELFLGEASLHKLDYGYDTTLDLIMDFLGALAMCFYGYLRVGAGGKEVIK